ncbi:MAG: toxin-antitoxin system HicB family antitoxin [Chloroflexi bacterium]|nr:toxin-antitoxin system HicB family antitoxin [Chloroflexota bacterium]
MPKPRIVVDTSVFIAHESARNLAKKESISINQLITLALAEKISALTAEDYLSNRAKRGNRRKFQKAMAKVRNAQPEEQDRL